MTSSFVVDTDLPAVLGKGQIGATTVHWALVEAAPGSSAEISARSHALLAELVQSRSVFAWRGLEREGPWTKPRPISAPHADVSISHSAGRILVAACTGGRLGVDIENFPFAAFDSAALRRRMCTSDEAATAASLDDVARRSYLARLWTAREAVAKAQGIGITALHREIRVAVSDSALVQPYEAHIAVLDDYSEPAIRRLTS